MFLKQVCSVSKVSLQSAGFNEVVNLSSCFDSISSVFNPTFFDEGNFTFAYSVSCIVLGTDVSLKCTYKETILVIDRAIKLVLKVVILPQR